MLSLIPSRVLQFNWTSFVYPHKQPPNFPKERSFPAQPLPSSSDSSLPRHPQRRFRSDNYQSNPYKHSSIQTVIHCLSCSNIGSTSTSQFLPFCPSSLLYTSLIIVGQYQQCIRMTSKTKQIAFKNPFDLIEDEEEEEPMSMPTNNQNRYQPAPTVVHNPLPFNPYQIKTEERVQKKPEIRTPATSVRESKVYAQAQAQAQEQRPMFIPEGNQQYANGFNPNQEQPLPKEAKEYPLDENGDPPLLIDIGIEPEVIKQRIIMVLKLSQPTYDIIHDPDLSGPIVIALTLGFLLLLAGKIHFGDIYAMFILGNSLLYCLLNFMSQTENIPFYNIMSILGYGLLPMLVLGFLGVFFSLNKGIGTVIALLIALWSSYAASNFMNVLMRECKDRKALIMYPLFLYYLSFTLIVIF